MNECVYKDSQICHRWGKSKEMKILKDNRQSHVVHSPHSHQHDWKIFLRKLNYSQPLPFPLSYSCIGNGHVHTLWFQFPITFTYCQIFITGRTSITLRMTNSIFIVSNYESSYNQFNQTIVTLKFQVIHFQAANNRTPWGMSESGQYLNY